ncbi:MAG: helix-turn-helix domain-containing protein [Gammaproteobacteria bacterium]|nr:helix-turn-helix domain-containing protein [Gammaproteobacteria bacterium]
MSNAAAITTNSPTITQWFDTGDSRQIKIDHNFCSTKEKSLHPHEHLFVAGDAQSQVYQILEGVVGIYELLADGRRQIATFCYPGDLIGLDHLQSFANSAEALCSARVRCIPLNTMDRLISTEPGFGQALLQVLSTELAETRDQLLSLGRKSAYEKVATFLLRIARRNQREGKNENDLYLPMRRSEIADYLGLTIETVSRNITKLKVARAIRLVSKNRIEVLDMNLLEDCAECSTH